MQIEWGQLILVAVGSLIALVTTYLNSRWTARNARELAQAQWRFEAGREAYKAAIAALDLGARFAGRTQPLAPRESYDLASAFIDLALEARVVFGLPIDAQVKEELVTAFFAVVDRIDSGGDRSWAADQLHEAIHKQNEEITSAWQHTIGVAK